MWRQAELNSMKLAPLTMYGWNKTDGVLSIHWDSIENMAAIRDRVALLMKGCKCKTGCTTGRCSCHKKGQACSEGCTCMHCKNMSHCVLNEEMDETLSREQTDDEVLDFVMESEYESDFADMYDDSESDDSLNI